MDYKEEYQKALERAKQGLPIDEVFPELKEGEDEKIRKEIISCIKSHVLPGGLLIREGEFYREDAISYLEKKKEPNDVSASTMAPGCWQGEEKSAEWSEDERIINQIISLIKEVQEDEDWHIGKWSDDAIAWLEKQKEQKPEPVFKVGDKIKLKSEPKYPYREIVDIRNGAYYFDEAVHLPFKEQDKWEAKQKPADLSKLMVHKEPYIAPVPTPIVADEQKLAEWSEFEKGYMRIVHKMKPEDFNDEGLKIAKECSAELLELARKELLSEKMLIKQTYNPEIHEAHELGRNEGIMLGKAEALKDLPRWNRLYSKENADKIPDCIIPGKALDNRLVHRGFELKITDLEKLPGFNEDEK